MARRAPTTMARAAPSSRPVGSGVRKRARGEHPPNDLLALVREGLAAFVHPDVADEVLLETSLRSGRDRFPASREAMRELADEHLGPALCERVGRAYAYEIMGHLDALLGPRPQRRGAPTLDATPPERSPAERSRSETQPPPPMDARWIVLVACDVTLEVALRAVCPGSVVTRVASLERVAGLDPKPDVVVVDARHPEDVRGPVPASLAAAVVVWGEGRSEGPLHRLPGSASFHELALLVARATPR